MNGEKARDRKKMVKRLKRTGYVKTKKVAEAMETVPRHLFLPEQLSHRAYVDSPLPIGGGQTISAPHMVAMMVEGLDLKAGMKVLEVGGGRGYHAAVISRIVGEEGDVVSMEILPELAERGKRVLDELDYNNVKIVIGDGSEGYEEGGPYHRISVACGAPSIPEPLIKQLNRGGKMLIPIGGEYYQNLIRITKKENKLKKENLGGVLFVPLKGKHGH
ncbi:MAG: protein-L-isoaspartate O-methyltransferase [Thermoplasmata archaeon]